MFFSCRGPINRCDKQIKREARNFDQKREVILKEMKEKKTKRLRLERKINIIEKEPDVLSLEADKKAKFSNLS